MTQSLDGPYECAKMCKELVNCPIVFGGPHMSVYPEETLKHKFVDFGINGEGEIVFLNLIKALENKTDYSNIEGLIYKKENKVVVNNPVIIEDLDSLPIPAFHLLPMENYNSITSLDKVSTMIATRGCPFNCLTGNTLINTVEGNIPIKDLVGRKKIGVYTYDRKTKEVFITDAINIRKTDINREIVRVTFDDASFIDCTPDHRFLTFKNGNQFGSTKEKVREAKDLEYKESVRAVKFYKSNNYIEVSWGRRKRNRRCRIVMGYLLGRKLKRTERVHHKKDKSNDLPENLEYCNNQKEHIQNHPEISERMKEDNPRKYLTKESMEKTRKKITGLKRSKESRLRYRESKLGKNNPNWKDGIARDKQKKPSRIKEINHKVVKVEYLKEKQDVYDLEVPATQWFFANNVLVHNCGFCYKSPCDIKHRKRSPKKIREEVEYLIKEFGVQEIMFYDDTLTVDKNFAKELCKELKPLNIVWGSPTRIDCVDKELLQEMYDAGCVRLRFGVESGNNDILKSMNKGVNKDQIRQVFKWCEEIGMESFAYFIIGYYGETEETAQETIDFACELNPDLVMFTLGTPLPKTPFWDAVVKDKLVDEDYWLKVTRDEHPDRLPYFVQNAEKWIKKAYKQFYFRPAYIWKKLKRINSWDYVKKNLKGVKAILEMR